VTTTTVVALADTHGNHHNVRLPGGDILIHAGDITSNYNSATATEQGHAGLNWLGRQKAEKGFHTVILVPGNHDRLFECLGPLASQELAASYGVVYLQDELYVTDGGIRIWGTPWTRAVPTGFSDYENCMYQYFGDIPTGLDILVSHSPPAGKFARSKRGHDEGSTALRRQVELVRPWNHIWGHVHACGGQSEPTGDGGIRANVSVGWQGVQPTVFETA
jgi:Icc-related predicted phosphoesterase